MDQKAVCSPIQRSAWRSPSGRIDNQCSRGSRTSRRMRPADSSTADVGATRRRTSRQWVRQSLMRASPPQRDRAVAGGWDQRAYVRSVERSTIVLTFRRAVILHNSVERCARGGEVGSVVSRDEWLSARTSFFEGERVHATAGRAEPPAARAALGAGRRLGTDSIRRRANARWRSSSTAGASSRSTTSCSVPNGTSGCPHCSFWADNFDGIDVHLHHRDVTFLAVSRAPLAKIERFKERMGWSFPWVSSFGSDFNFDYHVSFTPEERENGTAFYNYARDEPRSRRPRGRERVHRRTTPAPSSIRSSCYARGIDCRVVCLSTSRAAGGRCTGSTSRRAAGRRHPS